MEHQCKRCNYEVASMSAEHFGPARQGYPDVCPQCGGTLVTPEVTG